MSFLFSFFSFLAFFGLFPKNVAQASFGTQLKQTVANVKNTITQTTDNHDVDILARTIWGEARNEGYSGMQAVANVVMNRYAQAQQSNATARRWGRTVAEICQKKYQFSVWLVNDTQYPLIIGVSESDSRFKTALEIARKAVSGSLPDITGGADHYHADYVQPQWADARGHTATIGRHIFYNLA